MLGALVISAVVASVVFMVRWIHKDRIRKAQTVMEYLKQPAHILTAPLNMYYERISSDQTTPIIDISNRTELMKDLKDNWKTIRDEGLKLTDQMTPLKGELFFSSLIIKDDSWKKMYLKWYGDVEPSLQETCPVTSSILQKYPEIHLAMFSYLKKGGRIYPHAGPFRGCIRVHVGLQTPNDDNCYIKIGKEKYSWRDGEVVAFDDTYRHEVYNNTKQDRLILFMDLERDMKTGFASGLNRFLIRKIAPLTTRSNSKLEKIVTE